MNDSSVPFTRREEDDGRTIDGYKHLADNYFSSVILTCQIILNLKMVQLNCIFHLALKRMVPLYVHTVVQVGYM